MAVVGIITTQLWHEELIRGGSPYPAETYEPRIRIDRRTKSAVGEAS
jgi:hypothetical protein